MIGAVALLAIPAIVAAVVVLCASARGAKAEAIVDRIARDLDLG